MKHVPGNLPVVSHSLASGIHCVNNAITQAVVKRAWSQIVI